MRLTFDSLFFRSVLRTILQRAYRSKYFIQLSVYYNYTQIIYSKS